MTGWIFLRLIHKNDEAYGCELIHFITQEKKTVYGKLIIASKRLGGLFGSATGSVRNTGAVTANDSHCDEMKQEYQKKFFAYCGQAFSCQSVCPKQLPLDEIQSRINGRFR